jgi:hypothetical protein
MSSASIGRERVGFSRDRRSESYGTGISEHMSTMGDWEGRSFFRRIGAGLLCLTLVACAVPGQSLSTPVPTFPPTMDRKPRATIRSTPLPKPTAQPTATATPGDVVTPNKSVAGHRLQFEGCWSLETEEVSFEVRLEQEGLDVHGTFLLVKMCLVADELTACRIREGTLQGTLVTTRTVEARLAIPEYKGVGRFRLAAGPGDRTLHWEEIDYPDFGLSDSKSRYLPPSFDLRPCGG